MSESTKSIEEWQCWKTKKKERSMPSVDQCVKRMKSKYARKLIKKFELEKATHKRTPDVTHVKITKDEAGTSVDQTVYRSMIGRFLYLTASRLDIAYAVRVCARYQVNPKESQIIKYVCGTTNCGLWYTKETSSCLAGYCDADWTGNTEDCTSMSGGCFFMGNNRMSWFSNKMNKISISIAEAEYIAAGSCCRHLLWMKQMFEEYGVEQDVMMTQYDNMSAISISKKLVQHSRTKHIDIRHDLIRELVEKQLEYIFTKGLDNF